MRRAVAAARAIAVAACVAASAGAPAASPELTITTGGAARKYTADALLAHPAATSVTVPQDVAYKRTMTYRAVPFAALATGLPRDASVRFVASDGFAATMAAAPLLATGDDGARAYVAVEPPGAHWPPLKAGSAATAGPFYLVWLRPEKARIAPEQWPYQIAHVDEVAPLATRFPALLPADTVANADPIRRGFAVFTTNCIPCHTLNLAGDAKVGPDLNVPFNPTEYLREDALRRLIRNPAALRYWPDQKMPGFDAAVLSDRDLEDLVAYFFHMAKRKVALPAAPAAK